MDNWILKCQIKGTCIRVLGEDGIPVVLIPGMEGSGESCLDLAHWVYQKSSVSGAPVQLFLVDYSREKHL